MVARKQTAIVGLKVRLREPLRKKLETAAKKKGRLAQFRVGCPPGTVISY